MKKGKQQSPDARLENRNCMGRLTRKDDGLTIRQYLTIGLVALVIFSLAVWVSLTLGDYFANYIGPVY